MSRQRAFQAITVGLTLFVLAGLLEVLLRARPTIFGQHLGNYVFFRYGTGPGEMYYMAPGIDAFMMWPEFETDAYYNGWSWSHRTDARGFRNPPDRDSEVVLLGDSLIYGHGAEQDVVVSEVLRDRYGWRTYNLGQQADGLYQSYVKSRLFMEELAPKVLVHFAFVNDIGDLEVQRSAEQIDDPPELLRDDWSELRQRIAEIGAAGGQEGGLLQCPGARFPGGVWHEVKERMRRATDAGGSPLSEPLLDRARRTRAQRYYDRILRDLNARADAAGAELVVVHLAVLPGLDPAARGHSRALLRSAAEKAGAHYYDTGDAISGCDDCRLENDGHLNAKGHAVLAELVDGWLREVYPEGSEAR